MIRRLGWSALLLSGLVVLGTGCEDKGAKNDDAKKAADTTKNDPSKDAPKPVQAKDLPERSAPTPAVEDDEGEEPTDDGPDENDEGEDDDPGD